MPGGLNNFADLERLYGTSNPNADLNTRLTRASRDYLRIIVGERIQQGYNGRDAMNTARLYYSIRSVGSNETILEYIIDKHVSAAAEKHINNPNKITYLNEARERAIREYNAMIAYKQERDRIEAEYASRTRNIFESIPNVPSSNKKGGTKRKTRKTRKKKPVIK
jgi:hypothetical protein